MSSLLWRRSSAHSHFLSLLSLAQHVSSTLAQYGRLHLVVDHEGLLRGVDIQAARSHFAVGRHSKSVGVIHGLPRAVEQLSIKHLSRNLHSNELHVLMKQIENLAFIRI